MGVGSLELGGTTLKTRHAQFVVSLTSLAMVLFAVSWVVSLFNVVWVLSDSGWSIGLGSGCLIITGHRPEMPEEPGWYALEFMWTQQWLPLILQPWGVAIPLWIPEITLASGCGWGWFVLSRARRWARTGRCPNCGYDLKSQKTKCPECGSGFGLPRKS